jgi:hypothetical protein
MWNNDFLDYVEIRRRIERHLPGMFWVFVHLALFLAAVLALLGIEHPMYYYNGYTSSFIRPDLGFAMTFWSVLLLIHSLWTFRRSGATGKVRERAIERELQERLEQDDTQLLNDQRRVFRIRGLLDEDIRQRSGHFVGLLGFLILNAATWFVWAANGGRDSYTWQMTIPTAIAVLAPALALNLFRRRRRDQKLQALMSDHLVQVAKGKRKLSFDDLAERTVRLSDDGELVHADDDQVEVTQADSRYHT